MAWLLHNYWLPTINPSTESLRTVKELTPVIPIFKQYKTLMKTLTRDASLKSKYRQPLQALYRDFERWLSEARVSATASTGSVTWDAEDEDWKDRWALERFCDGLLEKGSLVPLSKR
jgi:ribosomal biogenesis protein LAS1